MPDYPQPGLRASRRRRRLIGQIDYSNPTVLQRFEELLNPANWIAAQDAYTYFNATSPNGGAWAEATGTVPPGTKQTIIQQETAGLIRAGVDPATAAAQANSDVTAVLTSANADPSQATSAPSSISDWLVIGAIGLAGFFAISRLL